MESMNESLGSLFTSAIYFSDRKVTCLDSIVELSTTLMFDYCIDTKSDGINSPFDSDTGCEVNEFIVYMVDMGAAIISECPVWLRPLYKRLTYITPFVCLVTENVLCVFSKLLIKYFKLKSKLIGSYCVLPRCLCTHLAQNFDTSSTEFDSKISYIVYLYDNLLACKISTLQIPT